MGSIGFIKRILPFLATFVVGIFIASFFVSISGPRFRARGWERHQQNQRLRIENEELRNENLRLRNGLEDQQWTPSETKCHRHDDWENRGVEFPVEPPPPPMPAAPRAKR